MKFIFSGVCKKLGGHGILLQNAFGFLQEHTEFADLHRSQMSYGWDWSRAMAAASIWDHVWLKACDNVRIEDFFFRSQGSPVAPQTFLPKNEKVLDFF